MFKRDPTSIPGKEFPLLGPAKRASILIKTEGALCIRVHILETKISLAHTVLVVCCFKWIWDSNRTFYSASATVLLRPPNLPVS